MDHTTGPRQDRDHSAPARVMAPEKFLQESGCSRCCREVNSRYDIDDSPDEQKVARLQNIAQSIVTTGATDD